MHAWTHRRKHTHTLTHIHTCKHTHKYSIQKSIHSDQEIKPHHHHTLVYKMIMRYKNKEKHFELGIKSDGGGGELWE